MAPVLSEKLSVSELKPLSPEAEAALVRSLTNALTATRPELTVTTLPNGRQIRSDGAVYDPQSGGWIFC